MRSVIIREYGNLDTVSVENVPIPEPAGDFVLVQMKCAAMNVSDLMFAYGQYLTTAPQPREFFRSVCS